MLRAAGLIDVEAQPLIHIYPPGYGRRSIVLDFVENSSALTDEHEWRIIASYAGAQHDLKFRPRGVVILIPYIECRFPSEALTEIIVGPGARDSLRGRAVSLLLQSTDLAHVSAARALASNMWFCRWRTTA